MAASRLWRALETTGAVRLTSNSLGRRFFSSTTPRSARYTRFGQSNQPGDNGGAVRRLKPLSVNDIRTQVVILAGVAGAVYFTLHLEQVPETGRWRFMDVSEKMEQSLARQAYKELLQEFHNSLLPREHLLTRHVARVAARLLEASNLGSLQEDSDAVLTGQQSPDMENNWTPEGSKKRNLQWKLLVVEDAKMINAMASYGVITVFTGILPICGDEDGLAAVLSHEIGHAVARHVSERLSFAKIVWVVTLAIDTFLVDLGLTRSVTSILLDLANSRAQETEADSIGLKIAARACYDPGAAPQVMLRLHELEKKANGVNFGNLLWLRSHPTGDQRAMTMRAMLPEAYDIRAAAPGCGGMGSLLGAFRDAATPFNDGSSPSEGWKSPWDR